MSVVADQAANKTLDRFEVALRADPETAQLAAMVMPYRGLAGPASELAAALDRLAAHWTQAREETG